MPSLLNKQPIFTAAPVLVTTIYNPEVVDILYSPATYLTNNSRIFNSTDTNGTLIERITVSCLGDPINNTSVAAKLVYLYLYDATSDLWSLYKTATMPTTTVTDTTPNPEVEWVFTGGLLLPTDFTIYIGTSVVSTQADRFAVTLEGSTYSQV
jgi:hypothetical protein